MVAAILCICSHINAQEDVNIGKSNIKIEGGRMTPEALWAMGRIAGASASPDGKQVVYQTGYYSVRANKSHQVICIVDADGSNNRQLTTSSKSETDPTWIDNGKSIAYLSGGELWTMNADGTNRRQLSKSGGAIEGFKFSPDGKQVILIKSLPFNKVIEKRHADLPKSTGRVVNDLMYRHWDHYVESIQHPFLADVTSEGITEGTDILQGEPFECPGEPFGGVEQLAWSPDGKQIAYTCRKKNGTQYSISTDTDIYLYNIGTRETKNLCKQPGYVAPAVDITKSLRNQAVNSPENVEKNNPGYDQNPQFSPDGKYIAWQSMARDGYEADRNRLCIYNIATGEKNYVTETFDSNVDAFCWMNDSETISFIGVWHGCVNAYQTNLRGDVRQITDNWADITSIQPIGKKDLLITRQSMSAPTDIYVVTPGKEAKKTKIQAITSENKQILDQLHLGKVQQRWAKTTDGKDLMYWVMLPSDFDENTVSYTHLTLPTNSRV